MDDKWAIQQILRQERSQSQQCGGYNQCDQNQTYKQTQHQTQNQQADPPKQNRCLTPFTYAGHIFLLGLIALASEVINLQAGNVLEVLLTPFQNENGSNTEQDLLGDEFDTVIDEDTFFEYDGL